MSHFTVLVPAKNKIDLESKLQPYHEYECTGIEDQYVIWVDDIHEENLQEFETETIPVILKNGQPIGTKYDKNPEIQVMWRREGIGFSSKDEFIIKEGYELVDMPKKEYYSDFDTYMKDECGYTEKRNGRFGRLTNPNKKWDWWQVGGRWTGLLRLKRNRIQVASAGNGNPGLMTLENVDHKYADYAPASEVDWEGMLADWRNKQRKWYSEHRYYFDMAQKEHPFHPEEAKIKAAELLTDDTHRGELANEIFGSLHTATIFEHAELLARKDNQHWFLDWDEISKVLMSQEQFEKTLDVARAQTYAFIDLEGNWQQRGEMGWFGMDDKSKGTQNYDEAWWLFVLSIPDNLIVYACDCHI